VLAVETFTDPARHAGACYAAPGFACAGLTRGYARGAGGRGYSFHGRVKACWLREVAPGGLAALGAVAAIAAAALLAGHRSPAAVAGYAGRLGQDALRLFGARWSHRRGGHVPPSESSFRRFLRALPDGTLPGPARLVEALALLREHIFKEQEGVFPAALASLETADWEAAEAVRSRVGTLLSS